MVQAKRVKTIKIRVTDDEFEALKFRSTKAHLAEWMRELCLGDGQTHLVKQTRSPDPVDPALLRQLAGIGNNLNQLARRINTGDWGVIDRIEIVSTLAAIERQLVGLRDEHRGSNGNAESA